jgi:hypothetical protein
MKLIKIIKTEVTESQAVIITGAVERNFVK